MKNWLKENWFKFSILSLLLLIALSFVFSYVVKPIINERKQLSCIENTRNEYREIWDEYCRVDNRQIETDGSCLLSNDRSNYLLDNYNDEKNDCFKRYPTR